MRRSRSLSNIPIPSNIRRDSKKRERSKSTLRNSRDRSGDLQTPLAHRPGFGKRIFEKKVSSTPASTNRGSCFDSSNFSGARSSVVNRNRSPATPSMQKLATDKKWVAEQYSKVQTFIQTSGLFSPELAGMIRPPTINTLVTLVSILLNRLTTTGPINSQNYTEVLLAKLKILQYPGTITMSTIKSANTMHGWPQFICFISWLIDRVNLGSNYTVDYDAETQKIHECQEAVLEFIITRYNIFSDGDCKESITQAEDDLFNNLASITETDLEAVEKVRNELETLRAQVEYSEIQLEELSAEHAKIKQSHLEKQQVIRRFEENDGDMESDIEDELQHLKRSVEAQIEKRDNIASDIKQLQNEIANQPCKIEQKEEILNQIEDLERAVTRKKTKLERYQLIRDDLDCDLRAKVVEIENLVDSWNVSVTKTFLPELQHFRLREKGFHAKKFLEEIIEINEARKILEKELSKEFETIKVDIEKIQQEKISLKEKLERFSEKKKNLYEFRDRLQADIDKMQNMIFNLQEIKNNQDAECKQLEEVLSQNSKLEEAKIKELDEQIQEATDNYKVMCKKGIALLVSASSMTMAHFSRIDEKMVSFLNNLVVATTESQDNVLRTCQELEAARELTKKLWSSVNED